VVGAAAVVGAPAALETAPPEVGAALVGAGRLRTTTVVFTIRFGRSALAAAVLFDPSAGSAPDDICNARPPPTARVAAHASAATRAVIFGTDGDRLVIEFLMLGVLDLVLCLILVLPGAAAR
jgi:hypothetical protein